MSAKRSSIRALLGATALAGALSMSVAGSAWAQDAQIQFDQPAQPLAQALRSYSAAADREIMFADAIVAGRTAPALKGAYTPEGALVALLDGTGLTVSRTASGVLLVQRASDPQSGSAAGDGAEGTVQALIVTAQKKEEQIQDVPIAISAFTEKSLDEQKIEGGFDLLKAIPNVTFSKNNFTSYNFSIRGIGTKAVSATTDPGVAVSFNNIALLQNRLFEQEYFDVERVEVLRGPQGTLYGRNATAGVINVISAKPNMTEFKGWVKGEVGNYHTKRASAMVNVPLIEDKLAVRFAGSLTDRQGYDYNSVTQHHVNGRDLWSARITVGFNPTENIRTSFIWERFNEDDNRSRTGKQLCHRDAGLAMVGNTPTTNDSQSNSSFARLFVPAMFSTGCKAGSLYDDGAFGTPNGLALPFVFGILALGGGDPGDHPLFPLGYDRFTNGPIPAQPLTLVGANDPYGGLMQSRDLRTIASFKDPVYRAKADVVEFNFDIDLGPSLTFFSQTAYNKDTVYSFQDYNRFNTLPIFQDTTKIVQDRPDSEGNPIPSFGVNVAPGGVFCDPQLGCSNTLAGFDISQGKGRQFTHELRLQSSFDGPLNFSAGANYTRFQTVIDYYVFYNLITAFAEIFPFNGGMWNPGPDLTKCMFSIDFSISPIDINDPRAVCPYIDPNPIESINGQGHNYFRSKNPYKLNSWAGFGEVYWQASDALKVTAGLRYTEDRKSFIPVPSQILLGRSLLAGGTVSKGYPELPAIKQKWGEWTGRLGLDWKPALSFTDQTMLYAFYSRGYKGGGANPPLPGFATLAETIEIAKELGLSDSDIQSNVDQGFYPVLKLTGVEYGPTFRPEFVNAYEVGAKNTLLGGAMTFNTDAFFYDYKDYQVSQIRDRSAINENFDAKIWGVEFETSIAPSRNFRLNANLGYLDTQIAKGMKSIDIMNRTQGHSDWIVAKPWVQMPSNCIVPVPVAEAWLHEFNPLYVQLCGGVGGTLGYFASFEPLIDPKFNAPYDISRYPDANGGAGFFADLGGNELPNSPHWTMNVGAQYGFDFLEGWRATVRGDAYWQSQSWARVYNDDPYDKLHGWYNVNLSVWIERPDDGLKIELYAKNLLDKTPITDAFLNSDDSALTTNVFVLDPRLIGLSIKKEF